MASQYAVKITGASTTYTFGTNPEYSVEDLERTHRNDTKPATLGSRRVRITLRRCKIDAATAGATVTALSSFLSTCANVRVVPTAFELLDSAGTAVPDVGTISHSGGWEEIAITGFRLPPGVFQLQASVEFEVEITARKVFADSNGVWFFSQRRSITYDDAGRERRELETEIKISEATANTIAGLVSTLSLAEDRPVGWHRVGPTNGSSGVAIRYTRYPVKTEAVVTSIVEEIGGGGTAPTGGESNSKSETVRLDSRRGVELVATQVDLAGGSDPLGTAEGYKPLVTALGSTSYDEWRQRATGSWEVKRLPGAYLTGRVTAVAIRRTLDEGGERLSPSLVTGSAAGVIRRSPWTPPTLVEEIVAYALAPTELTEFPLPAPLEHPWALASTVHSLPWIEHEGYGGGRDQHLWTRTVTRTYIWDGDPATKPLEDASVERAMMVQYMAGEAAY